MSKKPLIVKDTREKTGWDFPEDEVFAGTKIEKVNIGDYTIEGYSHLIFLERKATTSEISANALEDRFIKLLKRAKDYKYKFIICEFDWEDVLTFPINSGIPLYRHKYLKLKSGFVQAFICRLMLEFDIKVLFAGNADRAEKLTYNLLKYIYKRECLINEN